MKHQRTFRSLTAALASAAMLTSTLAVAAPSATLAADCLVWEEGSTTVFPAIDAADGTWLGLPKNAGCAMTLNGTGSSSGLGKLRGSPSFPTPLLNYAASSRALKSSETPTLYAWKIGGDAMVIQVSSSANMAFLGRVSAQTVQRIWNNTYTNWNQIPASDLASGATAPNQNIVADCRIVLSGTRDDMLSLFAITEAQEAAACDSRLTTSEQEANAAKTDYHIVYTSLANDGIAGTRALALGGGAPLTIGNASTFVTPSVATVQNGTYPAPRQLFLAVNKFGSMPPGQSHTNTTNYVKAYDFINYMASAAGQAFVSQVGFVPVSPFVPFPASDINLDGVVSLPDLGQITGKWATSDPVKGWVRADAVIDGVISLPDIGAVTGKWGLSGPGNAFVPPN